MSTLVRIRLVLLVAALVGLSLLTGLKAKDQPNSEAAKPAAKAEAGVKMVYAVEPKPLGDAVKKGLEYLVKQQHANGGWGQGGGWRTNLDPKAGGGRVEGAEVADPPDVGNTCIVLLALLRAGNTPTEGTYAKNVAKGLDFLMGKIEKSDDKSLYVTDVKGTQIQSKIGPFVDTFLSAMVLSELKGKIGDDKAGKRLLAAVSKTIGKMEKNQQKDGTFAGNHGWATVLSQGLGNKGFNYAAQNGVAVMGENLSRVQTQVAANFDAKTGGFGAGRPVDSAKATTRIAAAGGKGVAATAEAPAAASAPSDAGVSLYTSSAYASNAADSVRTSRLQEKKLREVLQKKDATKEEKANAEKKLKEIAQAEKLREDATMSVVKQLDQPAFVQGFGSNGGEEFLSFLNISELLLLKGGKDWEKWDKTMASSLTRVQDKDGSWSGQHCITGKTFCTGTALLVLLSDRIPFPVDALSKDKDGKKSAEQPEKKGASK